jgi:hypothetical protein
MAFNFDSLKDKVANLTLYDIKAGVRQVQNGENPQGVLLKVVRTMD